MPNHSPQRPLRALVFAVACEPLGGSESAPGWGLTLAASEFADVTLVTAAHHADRVRADAPREVLDRLTVIGVGRPRPSASHRIVKFPTYLWWYRRAMAYMSAKLREFDVVHHATLSVYWLPAAGVRDGVPNVWGPVGGAVTTPPGLWRLLGVTGVGGEILDAIATRSFSMLPATRRTWSNADERVIQNDATRAAMQADLADPRNTLINHVEFTRLPPTTCTSQPGTGEITWMSPMDRRKGPALAVHALAATRPDIRLTMVGDGPDLSKIRRLADQLGVSDRITFTGRVPRADAVRRVGDARAALFTGLREEGGVALAEAMLQGTPVIVLAHGGAKAVAAAATDPGRVQLVEPSTVTETAARLARAMERFTEEPPVARTPLLDQPGAIRRLEEIYRRAAAVRVST